MPYKDKEREREHGKGYRHKNKKRIAKQKKEYYQKNKERIAEQAKEYRQKNREKILARKKEYNKKNKEKRKEYYKKTRERDKEKKREYREKHKKRIAEKYKEYKKSHRKAQNIKGAILGNARRLVFRDPEYRKHFEKLFEPWMNWGNYGSGKGKWCIDHIKPRSCYADKILKHPERRKELIAEANRKENLRPMCFIKNSEDNHSNWRGDE